MKFNNSNIANIYQYLLEFHSEPEANYILTNSLAILGDKKIAVQEELTNYSIKRINEYKYPERLISFIKTTSDMSQKWKEYSFAKIACSSNLEEII